MPAVGTPGSLDDALTDPDLVTQLPGTPFE